MSEHAIPTYPVIRFIVKNGKAIAALLALAILSVAAYAFLMGGGPVVLRCGSDRRRAGRRGGAELR